MSWEVLVPIMLISLLFDIRYGFMGTENVDQANNMFDKVGNFADNIKHEFSEQKTSTN